MQEFDLANVYDEVRSEKPREPENSRNFRIFTSLTA